MDKILATDEVSEILRDNIIELDYNEYFHKTGRVLTTGDGIAEIYGFRWCWCWRNVRIWKWY